MTLAEGTLCDATRRAMAAARRGDLDAVRGALADRRLAIAAAAPWKPADALTLVEIIKDGVTIGRLLTDCKRNIVIRHNRLEQLRSLLAKNGAPGAINFEA
jgi:hypothetical protein